ncbi:lamin tail domain-containing protein [Candidatus Curtissbacteria bacterium]|nr:lamin tail domain-containing protein [Candidatus Curtissbacteria bacterium]
MAKLTALVISFLTIFIFAGSVLAASPSDVVINEVYYDVDSSHGSETTNEWIELYNKTSSSIDISNWQVIDNNSTKTVPASTPSIPANGLLIISPDATSWNFWSIESSVIKLVMAIGNGLSNTGDKLTLKDDSGNIIDQLSYGTNIDVWNPALPDVDEGHSLERYPGGVDNNVVADFVDQETPTPGMLIASYQPPSPSPSPSPTPTPSPSPSPSPSPKPPSPSPSPSKSPSPSPTQKPILGESTFNTNPTPTPKASPSGQEESSKTRFSLILIGSGLILIGFSSAFYMWYSKLLGNGENRSEKQDEES